MSVLAFLPRPHFAAERMHHELEPVADTEHGHSEVKDAFVRWRRVFVVDRPRRARENDPYRRAVLDFLERCRARQDDGEHILLADAARDKLRILRAKIEDDDGLVELRRSESRLGFHG